MNRDDHLIFEAYGDGPIFKGDRFTINKWVDAAKGVTHRYIDYDFQEVDDKLLLPSYRNATGIPIQADNEHAIAIMNRYFALIEEASKLLHDLHRPEVNAIPVDQLFTDEGKQVKEISNI